MPMRIIEIRKDGIQDIKEIKFQAIYNPQTQKMEDRLVYEYGEFFPFDKKIEKINNTTANNYVFKNRRNVNKKITLI